jgi:uridine phosphorylase
MTVERFLKQFDVHRDDLGRSYHIKARRMELNGYVMTCGSRERVLKASALIDEPKVVSDERGITVINGFYKTTPVTIFCSGMGPSSTEITFTEILFDMDLSKFRRPTVIRAGTAGSWHPNVVPDDLVIETGVVRSEGASIKVAPIEWPALTDTLTNLVICEVGARMGFGNRLHMGVGICKDTLYADEDPDRRSAVRNEVKLKQEEYEALGALSTSMESAPFIVLADFYNKKMSDYGLDVKISYSCVLLIVSPYYAQTAGVEFKVSDESETALVKLVLESLARKNQLDRAYLEGSEAPPLDIKSMMNYFYMTLGRPPA